MTSSSATRPSTGPAVTMLSPSLPGLRPRPLAVLLAHSGHDYVADYLDGLWRPYGPAASLPAPKSGSTNPL